MRNKTGLLRRLCCAVLGLLLAGLICVLPAHAAGENTTYTYTLSADDEWIRTQDAYLPGKIYLKGAGLSQPQDLFLRGGDIYIADTGNHRAPSVKTNWIRRWGFSCPRTARSMPPIPPRYGREL